jgi:hypothetical protein
MVAINTSVSISTETKHHDEQQFLNAPGHASYLVKVYVHFKIYLHFSFYFIV